MLIVWLLAGLPLLVGASLWGGSLWLPFPMPAGEAFSFYVVWLVAFVLSYGLPVAIAVSYVAAKLRRSN